MTTVVIFHSLNGTMHCDDGFAAAWVARKALGDKWAEGGTKFVPGCYGRPLDYDPVRGDSVVFLDFSLKRGPMLEFARGLGPTGHLTVLDHHQTAEAELDGLANLPKDGLPWMNIRFDMSRSGAMMTWDFYMRDQRPPKLLEYIQDGDLWQWRLPMSKQVQAAVRSYPQTFEAWDQLMVQEVDRLIQEGVGIRRWFEKQVMSLVPNARRAVIGGVEGLVCNAPPVFASELAGELAERSGTDFGACYYDYPNERGWSLRSRDWRDVSEIAVKFGGGGHKRAAGFASVTKFEPPV